MVLLLAIACTSPAPSPPEDSAWWPPCTDADGDYRCVEDGDCDDASAEVYPGREECFGDYVDGVDNDCDGVIDECDCSNTDIHPGASEICDGIDQDCDGLVDEGCE